MSKTKTKTKTKTKINAESSVKATPLTAVEIRKKAVDAALSVAGISAEPKTAGYQAYIDLIASGEDENMQKSMATVSGCGLVISGIWRRIGVCAKEIEPPYKIGSAVSRLFKIAKKAGAVREYKSGELPGPGDVVLVGSTNEVQHVYIVIAVHMDSIGILSVDGGQRTSNNDQAIRLKRRVWKDGIDTVEGATDPGGHQGRRVVRWIDVTKLPMTGAVEPKEPLPEPKEPLPDAPADKRSWPSILPRQQRTGANEEIKVKDCKLIIPSPKVPPPAQSEQQKAIVKAIKDFRSALPDRMGSIKQLSSGGYMYLGATKVFPESFNPKERLHSIVWKELLKEGGASSINTYDNQILTWGFGFGAAFGGLPAVMEELFALCPEARDLLLDAGIAMVREKGQAVWMVVNTETGAIELGKNALEMMKIDRKLLSVLITLGEDKPYAESSVEAQWRQIRKTSGKVPKYAESWSDEAIALGCHLTHWLPGYAWGMNNYSNTGGDVLQIVSLFGRILGEKNGGVKKNGAIVAEKFDPILHLKAFAGGAGLNAIKAVCSEPKEIDDPESDGACANKLLFRVVTKGVKTNQYYVVPAPACS